MQGGEDVRFAHVNILVIGPDHFGRIGNHSVLVCPFPYPTGPPGRGLRRIKLADTLLNFNKSG